MKKRNLLLVILAVLLVFGMVIGCGDLGEPEPPIEVSFASMTSSTTTSNFEVTLTLGFSEAISGLGATNITLTGIQGASVKSIAPSNSSGGYSLVIQNVTAQGTLKVKVTKSGYTISDPEKSVAITLSASDAVAKTAIKYFNKDFRVTFTISTGTSIESVIISVDTLEIKEAAFTPTGGTIQTSDDFLTFHISSWDTTSVPSFTDSSSVYTSTDFQDGFKLTGYIVDAHPQNTNNLYGTKTAPGFSATDITQKTAAVIYLYLGDVSPDLYLMRSMITKTSNTATDASKKTPIDGSDTDKRIRFYVN